MMICKIKRVGKLYCIFKYALFLMVVLLQHVLGVYLIGKTFLYLGARFIVGESIAVSVCILLNILFSVYMVVKISNNYTVSIGCGGKCEE